MIAGKRILVKGIVQGVGFRPFVYELANRFELRGWVRNTSSGVEIEVCGGSTDLDKFLAKLVDYPPPLARIEKITVEDSRYQEYQQFEIIESQPDPTAYVPISPDISICPDCLRELFDPDDRRHRYPFINCTNCGPRFTIVTDIPYDRPKTTMAIFSLCRDCQAEYDNPRNRRFHAQPVACPACGPQLSLLINGVEVAQREEALQRARGIIQSGKVVAVKGIGGFHLACNPYDTNAVELLRTRKLRSMKPFALMSSDLETIRRHAMVPPASEELLLSREKPVVLVQKLEESKLDPSIASGQSTFGFMLPYTPMHHLLLESATGFPDTLIMTSANRSEEPIAYRDADTHNHLPQLADAILTHNRDIHIRTDDSVFQCFMNASYPVRRSRGYAPDPIQLPFETCEILATGAELKNTFCISKGTNGFISHHIGDLENYETYEAFTQGIDHFERLFRAKPSILACDLHPDYLSTRYAISRSEEQNLPLYQIQHHHAHLAACLADNRQEEERPVIGLCFDGTGYGTDGTIWGGEVLVGDYKTYDRAYHLEPFLLPGSESAIRNPARIALSMLWQFGLDWDENLPPVKSLGQEERIAVQIQLEKRLNSPQTTSMGRLFDGISSLIGICHSATYEAQAAMELQSIADTSEPGSYDVPITGDQIDLAPMVIGIYNDLMNGFEPSVISARFHNSLANMSVAVSLAASRQYDTRMVALSGGVWQNMFLLEIAYKKLASAGLRPLVHRQVPTNDGGISLGQLVVAATLAEEG